MLKALKVVITQKALKQVNCASLFVEVCKLLNNNYLTSHFGKSVQPIA